MRRKCIEEIIPIENIEDNEVTLKNGKRISILKVEPINFNLKSSTEQNLILESYKKFLKQCDFDFQILIQTQKTDIDKLLKTLVNCITYEPEIGDIVRSYISLIKELSEVKGGISRRFYIVIKTDESRVSKIITGLSECGNVVEKCSYTEIVNVLKNSFKSMRKRESEDSLCN